MAEQVVNEEEKENVRKRPMGDSDCEEGPSRRVRTSEGMNVLDDNHISEQDIDNDHDNNDGDTNSSIWEEWQQFLNDPENTKGFMQLR